MTYDRIMPVSEEESFGRRAEYVAVDNTRNYNFSRTFTADSTRLELSRFKYGSRGSGTSSDLEDEETYKIGPMNNLGPYVNTEASGPAFGGSPMKMFVGGSSVSSGLLSGSSSASGLLSG